MNETLGEKIIKGLAALSGSNLTARVFGVGSAFLTIYVLSVRDYGLYKLVLAAAGLAAAFRLGGLDSLVFADAARLRGEGEREHLRHLTAEYGFFQISVSLLVFVILFFGAALIEKYFGAAIGGYVRIISFIFLAAPIEKIFALLFSIHLEFKILALFSALEEVIKFIGVVIMGWWLGGGLTAVLWAGVIASFGRFIFFLPRGLTLFIGFFGGRKVAARYLPNVRNWRSLELFTLLAAHGKWGVATQYLGEVVGKGKYWLIRAFTSTEAVALYALAESMYSQIFSLIPLYEVLAPVVPQQIKNRARMRQLFLFTIKYGTFAYVLGAILAFVFVPSLVSFLLPKYAPAMFLFKIVLLTALTGAAANATSSFFYAYREQKAFFGLALAQGIFVVSFGSLFLWLWGIKGAALTFVAAEFFYIGIRYLYLVRKYPNLYLNWKDLFSINSEEAGILRKIWSSFNPFLSWRR